ncbi:MAG TPA: tetratricopeptide repeat protein [Gammaproteobacteria bacterium]|nr:tetratricopeptide repeat protein [Gammaproteobacteria bacterium]
MTDLFHKQRLLSIAGLAILVLLAYAPGLGGSFEFDDEANIVRNQPLQITELTPAQLKQAAFSMQAGPLMRPISYLTLALNYYFGGLNPLYFKLTNLFIHLLTGLAIYWLSRQLLTACRRRIQPALTLRHIHWISLTVTAFWLLHPMALTSVLYVVQRMNSLSALFVVLGLAGYCQGRNRQLEGQSGVWFILAGVLLFMPLAMFSKENGALLPFFMLIAELTLFRFAMPDPKNRRWLLAFFAIVAVIPALFISGYLLTHLDQLIAGYSSRDFTLGERLLTQARVVWFYIGMTLAPSISQLGLFHDDIPLSTGLMAPPTTALAVFGLGLLLVAALAFLRRAPLLSFGLLFFLVGHSMESSVFALEMVHEHRNYLPMYGLLLPLCYYLLHPALPAKTGRARIALAVVFVGVLGVSTAIRASYWGNPLQLALMEARNHPDSARSQYRLGRMYWQLMELQPEHADDYASLARERFRQAAAADPGSTSGLFALVMLDARQGIPANSAQLDELVHRLQSRPFASASYSQLSDLSQCLVKGLCRLTKQQVNRIFTAGLANPTLRGSTRAKVLSEVMVIALMQGDLPRALTLGEEAVRADPKDPQHRLNYVSILIQSGQLEPARDMLQSLDHSQLQPFLQPRLLAQKKAFHDAERRLQRQ